MRWFLLLIISASAVWAQFPLPMPTRPTSFPLQSPDVQGGVVRWGNWSYSSAPLESHTNIVAISGGGYHDLSVTASGQVIAWKPPGIGGTVDDAVRVPTNLSNVVAVAAGTYFSLALKQDGGVVGWGYNAFGQTTVPSHITNAVAIGAGDSYSVALLANGQLVGWGNANGNRLAFPAAATNVVALSVGGGHGLALTAQGTVLAWGRNDYGQASVPAGLSNVVQIYAGWTHSLALKSDGSIAGWGANDYGQATAPIGLTNAVAVSGGETHSVAIRADGSLTAWGLNHNGQTNAPQGITSAIAVSTRQDNSIVLFANTYPVLSVRNEYGSPIQNNAYQNLTSVVGQTSAPTPLSIRNIGNAALVLSDIRLEGSAAGEFSLGTAVQTLEPNESTILELIFSPIASGSRNASLVIESSDPSTSSFTINLHGNGLSYTADTDGDGLNDAAEFTMSDLGFNWEVAQPSLVNVLYTNANRAKLYSELQYNANRTNGQTDVTTNPAAFNLFTQSQFADNRTAGQQDVVASPMTYGLYDSTSIMDLRMNGLMVQKQGSNAVVTFQTQTTTDLTQPFTNNGTPITNQVPMPGSKGFLRIQAK
jgi:hypothetical protein